MSLDYESLFSKIDKAKKKRWSQADTDKWTKQQKEDKEKRPNIKRETIPFDNSAKRGPYRRSSQERDRILGEKGSEETGGILSAAQRKARAAQAKLHGKKTGTETEPEHITRVPLTAEARRGRKRNAKRRKQEGKDKEAERIRAERGFPEKTPKQDEKARDRKDLESDLATKMPFVSQGEKGTKERTTAETKIIREHRERKAYAKRHSASRYQKWLKELDTEDRSIAERGEEADKEKKTKKQKRGKVVHATDQEAEYKRLMVEAGRVPGKTIKPSSDTISAKRSRADRKARAAEQAKPEEDTSTFDSEDPIEDIPDIEADDDERGDSTKSLWKAGWKDEGMEALKGALGALGQGKLNRYTGKKMKLVPRKTDREEKPRKKGQKQLDEFKSDSDYYMDAGGNPQRKDRVMKKYECPFCDNPNRIDVAALRKFLSVASSEHDLSDRKRYLIMQKREHEADVDAFHKKYIAISEAHGKHLVQQDELSEESRDKYKAEEGMGGMQMGAQRGLGHEGGNKQGSGQSAQVTEVVDKLHPKAERINEKVREKIESMSKSAYENYEQDESPETEPNKQQIPASKPKPDVFDSKKMYKKALIIKYKNIYKQLNI
jgi:hypothetical protein